jgi:hypothetical protein
VKADAALVRPNGIVVLHPPAALDADIPRIILPAHPETEHTIRLGNPAEDLLAVVSLLIGHKVENILGDLTHCLDEFSLAGIPAFDACHELRQVDMCGARHTLSPFALVEWARPWCH